MPPKGRKKGAASAKSGSNGIIAVKSKPNGVEEEFPAVEKIIEAKIEATKSGRGRKKAIVVENKEELEDKPVVDDEKLDGEVGDEFKKANGDDVPEDSEEVSPSSAAPEENGSSKDESEENVGSTDSEAEPEKATAGKGGRKKAVALPAVAEEEAASGLGKRGRKKAVAPEADEGATTEGKEEPEKVAGKRGRKKAEVVEDAEVKEEPEKTLGKRGRKKAVVVELAGDDEEVAEEPEKAVGKRGRKKAAVVEDEAKEEPEKAVGKRGRKKATVVEPVEIDISDSNEQLEKIAGKRGRNKSDKDAPEDEEEEEEQAPPAKRNTKPGATKKDKAAEEDDTEDFVPRKTRGGRNLKKVAAPPAGKGRKRKVVEEKGEVKQSKKGKALEEIDEEEDSSKVDADRQVKIVLKRDLDIDEMARNSSLDDANDDTKTKAAKGPSKSGRKRANQDADESKPEKIQKEEPAKAKAGSKKPQIPDVTALDFGNTSKTPDGKPWNFKIASWNVNGVRGWLEKNGMSYLHHEKPDILCIQETKCSKDKLPEELEVEGYHCHWLSGDKEGYSGVGIISKVKPLSITDGIGIEEHDGEGRAITAEYEDFYLVTTYVPNSGRGLVRLDYRKKWDEDFRAYLKTLDEKKPVVLCGDLNVSHKEIDIANPKGNKKNAGFTQEERDGFSALLEEGFVDTFRQLYPDTKDAYTFWTYMMNARAKNVGWRLDYFVISERFKDHLCDSLIRKEVFGSDHCPVALLLHI